MLAKSSIPNIFKGIALFTPGGDLIYDIDPTKQSQWHVHLCQELQKILNLSDSPHFLVPGYTATVERWFDPQIQQVKTIAEVYPATRRYIPLLEVLFELDATTNWHIAPWQEEHCSRAIIETYRPRFPQLWEQHDLIIRSDSQHRATFKLENQFETTSLEQRDRNLKPQGYVLHLFISSNHTNAEQILSNIHQLLEERLANSYTLKIIDIANNLEQAEIYHITTIPTLIRVSPKPTRRIIGQLDDIERILSIIVRD